MNFKERSLRTQVTYIKMKKILRKFDTLKDTKALEEDYYELLDNSENHTECDYLKVLYNVRTETQYKENNGKFGFTKHISYYWCMFKNFGLIILLFIAPIFFIIFKFLSCSLSYECL